MLKMNKHLVVLTEVQIHGLLGGNDGGKPRPGDPSEPPPESLVFKSQNERDMTYTG